ncbi:MAG: hypothetical protein VX367_09955 [SAR324 cluster bacterium]|nr:hypothetical protein [SAR324 cluster bacterium]
MERWTEGGMEGQKDGHLEIHPGHLPFEADAQNVKFDGQTDRQHGV